MEGGGGGEGSFRVGRRIGNAGGQTAWLGGFMLAPNKDNFKKSPTLIERRAPISQNTQTPP